MSEYSGNADSCDHLDRLMGRDVSSRLVSVKRISALEAAVCRLRTQHPLTSRHVVLHSANLQRQAIAMVINPFESMG